MPYRRLVLLCLAAMMLVAGAIPLAQEAPEAEALPEIEYYRAHPRFHVPVVEGWDNASTSDFARFLTEEFHGEIVVEEYPGDDVSANLLALVTARFGAPSETLYSDKVNLRDGTWELVIYQSGDTLVSAMGVARRGNTYIIALAESAPDANVAVMIVPDEAGATPLDVPRPGVNAAIARLTDSDVSAQDGAPERVALPSGDWTRYRFDTESGPLVAEGLHVGAATFVTIATGDGDLAALADELGNAHDTVYFGFFLTPDNEQYLWLGLGLSAIAMLVYLGSLYLRYRNARQDLALVEELEEEAVGA
jgi:hypothetical protein